MIMGQQQRKSAVRYQSKESLTLNCALEANLNFGRAVIYCMRDAATYSRNLPSLCLVMNSALHGAAEKEPPANTNRGSQICSNKPQSYAT